MTMTQVVKQENIVGKNEIWSESPAPEDIHLLTSHCGGQCRAWGAGRCCDLNRSDILWTLTWLQVNEVALCVWAKTMSSQDHRSWCSAHKASLSIDTQVSQLVFFFFYHRYILHCEVIVVCTSIGLETFVQSDFSWLILKRSLFFPEGNFDVQAATLAVTIHLWKSCINELS